MLSTTTPSDDKLYMTDDLEGRLDLASLEDPPKVEHDVGPEPKVEEDFYKANGFSLGQLTYPISEVELPPPPKVTVAVVFDGDESFVLEGSLSSLSFGPEGWLCAFGAEDSKGVFPIALRAAKDPIASILVSLPNGSFSMVTNVDCTVSFSYGSAVITVTSDEARYV